MLKEAETLFKKVIKLVIKKMYSNYLFELFNNLEFVYQE